MNFKREQETLGVGCVARVQTYLSTKQHSASQLCMDCEIFADKTLFPLPDGPNMINGSFDNADFVVGEVK